MKHLYLACLACAGVLLIASVAAQRAGSVAAFQVAVAPEAEQIVQWFLEAIYFRQYDRLSDLTGSGFHFEFDQGTAAAHDGNRDQFLSWIRNSRVNVDQRSSGFADGEVTATVFVTATDLPKLPHPHTVNAKFLVNGFQVVSFIAEPSDQTRA